MSFTSQVKEELARVQPTCSHCDAALLSALMRIEGTMQISGSGQMKIMLDTDSPNVARLVVKLMHTIFGLGTEHTLRQNVLHKTPNYLIEVPPQRGLNEALDVMGIVTQNGFVTGIEPKLVEKRCCAASYLRGAFLGSGFIANPRGDFHFEMTCANEALANDIATLLCERNINAKVTHRRSNYIVYLKSGTAISEFLALVGAHQCALLMENERVIKSVRNDVNRRVNAEIANQQKASDASLEQIMAIHTVIDKYGLENLPPALQQIIVLRVSHPNATLKELGQFADPPLSKSAVYHRVRRIEELAAGESD